MLVDVVDSVMQLAELVDDDVGLVFNNRPKLVDVNASLPPILLPKLGELLRLDT